MTKYALTLIVAILGYFFYLEEYNYPSYAAIGLAAGTALICFIIFDDIENFKKKKDERKWEEYRQKVITTAPEKVEQKESTNEVRAEDYNFLFTMTTNENKE